VQLRPSNFVTLLEVLSSLLFLCAAPALPPQASVPDLKEIRRTLERATNKSGYEAGAYSAARELADVHGAAAMELRLDLFDRFLDTYRGVYLRDWFYSGMLRASSPEEGALLAAAAADPKRSELGRRLCLEALERSQATAPAKALSARSLIRAKGDLARIWQRTLGTLFADGRLDFGKHGGPQAVAKLRKLLLQAGPPLTGLAQLPSLSAEERAALSATALGAKDPGDRAAALRALAARPDTRPEELLPAIAAALHQESCGPRRAALDLILSMPLPAATPELVSALEEEASHPGGRFSHDFGNALMALTGQELGYAPQNWRRWWAGEGAAWLERARRAGSQRERELLPPPRLADSGPTIAKVFGLPVDSNRLMILVDGSGSMRMDHLGDRTCADAAADELESFLDQFPEDGLFDLAVIGDQAQPAFQHLVPARRKNRAAALSFIRKYPFGGTSALYDLLIWAQRQPGVDTILLISDGGGSSGSHQYPGHMLAGLEREYARTGVRVHGICVGHDPPKIRFMERLARATGGILVRPPG